MSSPAAPFPVFESEPNRGKWKYTPTPYIDEQIRAAYRRQRLGDRQALTIVSRRLGWPRHAVVRRGAELGVSRTKERPWLEAEEEILQRCGHQPLSAIQRQLSTGGFQRSLTAIRVKMTRLHIKSNLDGYSACSLARAFGVDTHKVVAWIRRNLLRAERRGTNRGAAQGGDIWWIPRNEVKRFVMRAPEEIDLARVEKFWFLDLLTDGRICR